MRALLVAVLGLVLRVFYRRIEIGGLERVPAEPVPALFVLNHPNALLDPLLILCAAPRRVSFLAKSTIFKMPVLGWIARGLDSLPVYRQQDQGEDPKKNQQTFAAARELLGSGGTIAIFPEGTSHSDPTLKPMKSGAARIALSARAGLDRLAIVPAGLYYTQKMTFRSKALVVYGLPIEVERAPLDEGGEPRREDVAALSRRIDEAIRAVTLNADAREGLDLVARAERVFSAAEADEPGAAPVANPLARELELRRRFQEGYTFFREHEPDAIARLDARIRRYERELESAGGLDPRTLRARYPAGTVASFALARVAQILLVLPLAALGAALHWPAYRLTGVLSRRVAKSEDDVVATAKVLSAMLLFPLTWVAVALAVALAGGEWLAAAAVLLVAPTLGWLALRFGEILESTLAAARAFVYYVARPRFFANLLAERRAIRDEIVRLGAELDRARGPADTLAAS